MAALASPAAGPVASAAELLDDPRRDRLFIDVRLGEPEDEYADYRKCHIHGAVHAQIREVFAAQPTEETGNLPLPEVGELELRLREWGVNHATEVIVYGRTPAIAARGWWTLAWAGLEKVRVLDGGLRAWREAGGPVAEGDPAPPAALSAPLRLPGGRLADIAVSDLAGLGADVIVVDARDEAAYELGHLPRAINLPAADQWTPRTLLRPAWQIADTYRAAGIRSGDEVVVYCGGGVLSALEVLTLRSAGVAAALYVGSWSEWIRDPHRRALACVGEPTLEEGQHGH